LQSDRFSTGSAKVPEPRIASAEPKPEGGTIGRICQAAYKLVYSPNNVATVTFPLLIDGRLADGNYRLTVKPENIQDAAGNGFAASYSFEFFVFTADANRDRKVDTQDFNLLAANFGGSSKVFSQGDFNYSGAIDSTDFDVLVTQYGKQLQAPTSMGAIGGAKVGPTVSIFSPSGALADSDDSELTEWI